MTENEGISVELIRHLVTTLQNQQAALNDQRKENSEMFREFRIVIDRLKESNASDWRSITEQLHELSEATVQRNEQRLSDHRELTTRLTLYAGAVAMGAGTLSSMLIAWVSGRFF